MPKKMKESGVEWIGSIPEHWTVQRLQWCLQDINVKNNPIQTTQVLSLTNKLGVVPYEEKGNQGNKAKENLEEYKIAYENTLVINSMNVIIGSVGISQYYGCVSPVYYVFSATSNADLRFINYIFHTTGFQKELRKYAKGILEIRLRISVSDTLRRCIALPTLDEQCRIADYLDEKCQEIDAAIEKTRSSIDEYKRLKQSIITTAVVKGINSDAKLKDTGIEWIGWIPAHWDDAKLKYFATLRAGVTLGKTYPNGVELVEVPYLRVANVQGSFVDLSDVATISVLPEEIEKYRLHKGEVLMTEGGDRDKLGRGCVWNGEIDPCLHQNHVFAVTTDPTKLLGQFLAYMTTSIVARTYFDITAKKTTNLACTNSTTILNFTMPIPPVEEQEEIVEYLDKKCTEVDALIAKKEQFLVELENYKKSLIYEYVTGKKEVPWDN